tara:strand:+ start:1509 stop:2096 length:588 start_codon:yes stop_codon:yes gene_type:complete
MGMHVSTLLNVPSKGFETYIYVADPDGQFTDWLNENFQNVSLQVGKHNLIIRGSSDSYDKELWDFMVEHCKDDLFGLLESLFHESASLIVSEGALHQQSGKVHVIPVLSLAGDKEFTGKELAGEILKVVVSAVNNGNLESKLSELGAVEFNIQGSKQKIIISTLKFINNHFELKPSFAGIGINLNQMIENLIKRY